MKQKIDVINVMKLDAKNAKKSQLNALLVMKIIFQKIIIVGNAQNAKSNMNLHANVKAAKQDII